MHKNDEAAAVLAGEIELKAMVDQGSCQHVDKENPIPLELLGINQVKPRRLGKRELLFSWMWPVSRRGITKDEVRRMEDFMVNTRDRPIRLQSINRTSNLKQTFCPQVFTQEQLNDIQMQEFKANNNEAARQRVLASMSERTKAPLTPEALLPLWVVMSIPILMIALHLYLIYYFRPDLFQPEEQLVVI